MSLDSHFKIIFCKEYALLFVIVRETTINGESALPFLQLSISFLRSCLDKHDLYCIFSKAKLAE